MKLRSRFGMTIATATIGALGVLGVAACSPSPSSQASLATMTPEATALTALGFADTDVTGGSASDGPGNAPADVTATGSATPDASAAPNKRRHPSLRRLLIRRATIAKHVEHGSVTVQTRNGNETIDVQRGTITAISSTSMTVKSADGFTLTWTFGDKMRVLENRSTIQPTDVKAGETVGVAGEKSGSTETARLVVIPKQGTSK
ncbi:MAG TPA: hypothetical protein VIR00_00945 [Micromonosporaceae bacterium]|jgi:hypothetical protein